MRLIEQLGCELDDHSFDHLIVVAEPRTLGHLRDVLPARLAERVRIELAKELAGMPEKKMRTTVETLWADHAKARRTSLAK